MRTSIIIHKTFKANLFVSVRKILQYGDIYSIGSCTMILETFT